MRRQLTELRASVAAEGDHLFERWRRRIGRDEYLPSARNLAHYLALRRRDLRDVQLELMPWGLSSLGRCEARVLANLDAVGASLAAISDPHPDVAFEPNPDAFFRGHDLLRRHSEAALGPTPRKRTVRIMVTLPTEAARNVERVRELVDAGMDIARINCAHDDAASWEAMAANVRRAAAEGGRSCLVCCDLVGPRARVASTTVRYEERVRAGEHLLMTTAATPVDARWRRQFECSLPEVVGQLHDGAEVRVNEGRLGAVVEERVEHGLLLRVTEARDRGEHLRTGKGLNFPDVDLRISPLGKRDLRDLDAITRFADIIGYSFVQRPEDIAMLQSELAARGAVGAALIAKIETREAVRNLPELIVQGAGRQPLAIMIARGDLAVEIGYRRLAELQEELLWLCEAAHVPVIWATQVLDNLVKKGVHNRAEITDAAMAERAECVMLNKGPYAGDAVALLDDVFGRMEGHQFKKTSRLRALHAWLETDADREVR